MKFRCQKKDTTKRLTEGNTLGVPREQVPPPDQMLNLAVAKGTQTGAQ